MAEATDPGPAESPRPGRMRARELIVQALYSELCGGEMAPDPAHKAKSPGPVSPDWRGEILQELSSKLEELDDLIAEMSSRSLSEIDRAELCILRLAGYELKYAPDVPWKVVIDEAVRMARLYCSPDSYRFINGIVEQMAFSLDPTRSAKS